MAGEFDFSKDLGFTADDFKGKSKSEATELIIKRATAKKEAFESEAEKELIENIKSKLPELEKFFEKPFQIYVKEVGQRKKPTPVKVVGYIVENKSIIVSYNEKLYQIKNNDLIKSADMLTELRASKPKNSKAK
jgi:hypothetical protein